MVKKNYSSDLFSYLDWVLKKNRKDLDHENLPYPFIVNRWLSMADPSIAQIVNATTNRWITEDGLAKDSLSMAKFMRTILPKFIKKISYIKKPTNEKDTIDCGNYAQSMQLSRREIEIYEKTLAELHTKVK
jgi:hypothetical protein